MKEKLSRVFSWIKKKITRRKKQDKVFLWDDLGAWSDSRKLLEGSNERMRELLNRIKDREDELSGLEDEQYD